MEHRRPNLVKALKQMGDFYMELVRVTAAIRLRHFTIIFFFSFCELEMGFSVMGSIGFTNIAIGYLQNSQMRLFDSIGHNVGRFF